MKVAIVHYWLVGMRGGEKVIEALCELYPEADVFTHVYRPERISPVIRSHRVTTTFIDRLPMAHRMYQKYLPLMPLALEQLDLSAYDLVISSESGPAKGVLTRPDALHVCYCHTPMRYVWSGYHDYLSSAGPVIRPLMPYAIHRLRQWDLATAARVDRFIANSETVAQRIWRVYRRDSTVINPPVETRRFATAEAPGDHYLFVSQLVSYKRADVAIEAFNRMGRKLVVVGEGEEFRRLKQMAGPTVELLGHCSAAELDRQYAACRALVFTANEDFGIVPVEAMAAGRPVIALNRGGATETVKDGLSGLFFDQQTPEALIEAVERFEAQERRFDPAAIQSYAARFDGAVFRTRLRETIDSWMNGEEPSLAPARAAVHSARGRELAPA
ncbi:glycosyl transferase (plasmid) [Azospirillum humicireducens]|uniref:Glycosyl transferase n=1 Tax=Azospirillum humicireducens TaxID=1226968 RepID=A0A2R4VWY6_9PROT|nr:glycosyltransferase [Azospirillum humicireducens]AWB08942.1 glycosyl transferase [Azospirillum humicireducens]